MTRTPPIKSEMTPTIRTEERMSLSDSFINCLQNILHFYGLRKTVFMNRKYSPTDIKIFFIMYKIYFDVAKINKFLFLNSVFRYHYKICRWNFSL